MDSERTTTTPAAIDHGTMTYRELRKQADISIPAGHRAGVLNVLGYLNLMALFATIVGVIAMMIALFASCIAFGNALVYGFDTIQAIIMETVASIDARSLTANVTGVLLCVIGAMPMIFYLMGRTFGYQSTTGYD